MRVVGTNITAMGTKKSRKIQDGNGKARRKKKRARTCQRDYKTTPPRLNYYCHCQPSANPKDDIWSTEVFAPILNVAIFDDLEQAIEWNNAVPQGLSSSLWTRDIRNVGKWIGPAGSDAGIVNVGDVP